MIWSVSRASRRAPSELLDIAAWASRLTGMPDIWTALQFDAAVSLFGNWMESKLAEVDYSDPKHPRHPHTVDSLLNDTGQGGFLRALQGRKGMIVRLK